MASQFITGAIKEGKKQGLVLKANPIMTLKGRA